MGRSSLFVLGFVLFAATGCKPKPIPIQAELVEVTPEAIAIRVTSEPGARVELSNHVRADGGTVVPPSGSVILTYPRKSWSGYYGAAMDVAAGRKGFGKDRWGTTRVTLPAPVASLLLLPEGTNGGGALLHTTRENTAGTIALARDVTVNGKPAPVVQWAPRETALRVVVGSPKGAKVTLGSVTREASATGLTELDLPSADIAGHVQMETIALKNQTIAIPLAVDTKGNRVASEVVLHPVMKSDQRSPWLAEHLDRVRAFPFVSTAPVEALLWRTSYGEVVHIGAPGLVKDARFVVLETAETRTGEACRYGSFSYTIRYDDVTLHVHDARTGIEAAKATFRSPRADCELYSSKNMGKERTYRANETTFREWLTKGLAKGFR